MGQNPTNNVADDVWIAFAQIWQTFDVSAAQSCVAADNHIGETQVGPGGSGAFLAIPTYY